MQLGTVAGRQVRVRFDRTLRAERTIFAAKVRAARALLGLSQEEMADRIGLTQKSVHRIEQGLVEPKVRTVFAIEQFWARCGLVFEDQEDGGFRLAVAGSILGQRADT